MRLNGQQKIHFKPVEKSGATGAVMAKALRAGGALKAGAALSAVLLSAGTALAGGFAPHEQSVVFQGTSFAGSAAGGALSSMFWNPAALGQFDGINSESAYSLIMPDTEMTAVGGTLLGAGTSRNSGDIGDTAVLPASYYSYQLNDKIVLGMSINAPFGLTTDPSNSLWDGAALARESKIETYNFAPSVSYRVAPGFLIGAGLQVEYIKARLARAFVSPLNPAEITVKGDDIAVGFTAGALFSPAPGTSIGIGYRSSIDHDIDGNIIGAVFVPNVNAPLKTPEIVTASFRQVIAQDWTLLGTVEWTNWSRVQQLQVFSAGGALVDQLGIGYDDGWYFSGGLEHAYSDTLTLRGGVAYEISPASADTSRIVQVPDADRIWLSVGASYKYSEWTTLDFAYSHVFVEDENFATGGTFGTLAGTVDSSADIISVGVRSKLDWLFSGSN